MVYLRVPSNLVAMVSRKLFWGARRPLRPGIWSDEYQSPNLLFLRGNFS